ncbi:MAG: serine/threonine-protein kinase [Myxococcota bacterium]
MTVTYHFVQCLGRGGFGEVYLAHRRTPDGLERKVAVKILRSDLPDPDLAMHRLADEARLLTILDHPAIVAALELTRIDDRVALVTEYIEGTDLSRYCSPKRRLPARVVVSAVAEVASALDCAFNTPSPETGKPMALVHRDIKPENVRISRHGEVKLLDFGIARSHEVGRRAKTTTGNLPFTPGYTAPEAFVALRQEPATDVFALGATAYRLLAGERFYEGVRLADQAALATAPDVFRRYLEARLAALPATQPSVVPLLRACLAYDPAHRPTAAALRERAEALAEVLPGPSLKAWARGQLEAEPRARGGEPRRARSSRPTRPACARSGCRGRRPSAVAVRGAHGGAAAAASRSGGLGAVDPHAVALAGRGGGGARAAGGAVPVGRGGRWAGGAHRGDGADGGGLVPRRAVGGLVSP